MRKNILYDLFSIRVPCLHKQHPGRACTAGWSSLTEPDADPPAVAFSARQSIKCVLTSLNRGICQVLDSEDGGEVWTNLVNVKKASSTPSFTFAEVSMNKLMPSSLASPRACSYVTALSSVLSDLVPMRILLKYFGTYWSTSECHVWISACRWLGSRMRF